MGYDPHPIGMTYVFPMADLSKSNVQQRHPA
jgi:hypothetical protein